jgi:hypothetical protein
VDVKKNLFACGQGSWRGRRLENAVFLHHRCEREDLACLGGPVEIDLVLGTDGPAAWINTAWSLSEELGTG